MNRRGFFGNLLKGAAAVAAAPIAVKLAEAHTLSEAGAPSPIAVDPVPPVEPVQPASYDWQHMGYAVDRCDSSAYITVCSTQANAPDMRIRMPHYYFSTSMSS